MTRLVLAPSQCTQIEKAARAAFPRECCGLIEGVRQGDTIRVTDVHPTRNIAERSDRFEVRRVVALRIV